MKKSKIIIPYKGNEGKSILPILLKFRYNNVIDINDLKKLNKVFLEGEDTEYEIESDDLEYFLGYLSEIEIVYEVG
jgi:hypothetical protein